MTRDTTAGNDDATSARPPRPRAGNHEPVDSPPSYQHSPAGLSLSMRRSSCTCPRRLAQLAAHLNCKSRSDEPLQLTGAASELGHVNPVLSGATDGDEEAVLSELLDDEAMAAFVRDGFVTFQLDELPAEWHESVAADARAAHDVSPGDQSAIWRKLAPKMESVVNAPRFKGVMRSLAGPDYMMQPSGHMHLSNTAGQSFRESLPQI